MKVFAWGLTVLVGIVLCATGGAYAGGAEGATAGQKLFVKNRCQSCHSLKALKLEKKKVEAEGEEAKEAVAAGANSTKKEPPDLSGVGLKRKVEWIQGWLLKKEMIDGKKHRKTFRGTPEELKTISAWLATMKTEIDKGKKAEQ